MHSPKVDLTVSRDACEALKRFIQRLDIQEPVTSIVWGVEPDTHRGEWLVGWHSRDNVPSDWIQEIEGYAFVFDGASVDLLRGHTLDWVDGRFLVTHRIPS